MGPAAACTGCGGTNPHRASRLVMYSSGPIPWQSPVDLVTAWLGPFDWPPLAGGEGSAATICLLFRPGGHGRTVLHFRHDDGGPLT